MTHTAAQKLGCLCDDCPLKKCEGPCLPASLKRRIPAVLTIVGEHPGPQEIETQTFFAGNSGRFIDQTWNKVRVPTNRIHQTNVVLCMSETPVAAKEWKKAVECCRPRLIAELRRVKSKHVLGYGNWALWGLTGKTTITNWMGAPRDVLEAISANTDVEQATCTFQPAHVLRPDGRAYIPVVRIHTARAYGLATGKIAPWKWPKILTTPSLEMVRELKKILKGRLPVGLDLEDYGDPLHPTIMAIGVATKNVAISIPCHGYYAKGKEWVPPIEEWKHGKQCLSLIRKIVEKRALKKVYQHGQHDILGFESLGWTPRGYHFDTLISHMVVAPLMRHKLSLIACIEFHAPRWKDEFSAGTDLKGSAAFQKRRSIELREYNAKDAYMTVILMGPLEERISQLHNGEEIFAGYMRRARIAVGMRRVGVRVDRSKFDRHRKVLGRRKALARRELREVAAAFGMHKPFRKRRKGEYKDRYRERKRTYVKAALKKREYYNPNATAHNNRLFFDKMGVRVRKYGKSGAPSLDARYLSDLVGHPNILVQTASRALLRYRRYAKLRDTYVGNTMAALISSDGCVHPSWNVSGAKTHRWACSDPNMTNIPPPKIVREKVVAPGLRDIFIAHKDEGWILAGDYSQIELRILAMLSGDPKLLKWYREGVDVHAKNAADLFGREWTKAGETRRKRLRTLAKRFIFGLNYGGSARTIWASLVVDFPHLRLVHVERLIERWYALHPKIKEWQNRQLRFARKNGYTQAPLSEFRVHYNGSPEPTKVYNFPVQHAAAVIINRAIERVERLVKKMLIMQVHDELVLSTPKSQAAVVRAARILWKEMPETVTINGHKMTISVDLKIGRNYGSCEEISNIRKLKQEMARVIKLERRAARAANAIAA